MKILAATAILVFLRAVQQMNVVGGHYLAAVITPYGIAPYGIAAAEVAMVLWVVDAGWSAVPWVGTGGAIGVVIAMRVHRRVFR